MSQSQLKEMSEPRSTGPEVRSEELPEDKKNEAAIVFARAMYFYRQGDLKRAIELFDKVLVASQEDPQRDVACVAAHISLFKIHRSLGNEQEARDHFNKAVRLGASAERLKEY